MFKKLEAAVHALREGGVELTDTDFEPLVGDEPPAAVAAAGREFVAAWREYRRALSLKKQLQPPSARPRRKNVIGQQDEYDRLLNELLDGEKPPTPEQLAEFVYYEHGWCGTGAMTFANANQQAILLACLRHRRFGDAVEMLLNSAGSDRLRAELLTALGFDWRKVIAGAWLGGKYDTLWSLCLHSSEESAQLVVRWAELHWDEAVARGGQALERHAIRSGTSTPHAGTAPPARSGECRDSSDQGTHCRVPSHQCHATPRRVRSSAEIRGDFGHLPKLEGQFAGWKAAEVSFEVNALSPPHFTTASLAIESAP